MLKVTRSVSSSFQFFGLLLTILGLFLMGGSSRGDVESIAILNPAIIVGCGTALFTLKLEHWHDRKWLTLGAGALILLVCTYLLPIPMQLGSTSLGATDRSEIYMVADVSGAPQILAMAPFAGWQSIIFLLAPLCVLLFAVQLQQDDLSLVLTMLIVVGTISGILGVLQLAGGAAGPLYFYHFTNYGSAVGLFANRNHSAVFLACLFPMLATFATSAGGRNKGIKNWRQLVAIAIGIMLVPLILVTGSRSGMVTAVVGLIGSLLLYTSLARHDRGSPAGLALRPVLAAGAVISLVFVTLYFSRAEAIERLFAENNVLDDRAVFWASSLELFWHYFPLGFGPGSFVPAFQMQEPLILLDATYLNMLHNEWLETALTFGIPGVAIMAVGLAYYIRRSFLLWMRMDGARATVALGRMASIVIAILAIASMSDYPLRTPAMAGFAALVLVWFMYADRKLVPR